MIGTHPNTIKKPWKEREQQAHMIKEETWNQTGLEIETHPQKYQVETRHNRHAHKIEVASNMDVFIFLDAQKRSWAQM